MPAQGRLVTGQGEHAPVVVPVRLHVEDAQTRDGLQGGDRLGHYLGPAALADVGDAFDDPGHGP